MSISSSLRPRALPLLSALATVAALTACQPARLTDTQEIDAALLDLQEQRALALQAARQDASEQNLATLIDLGLWSEAREELARLEPGSPVRTLTHARLAFKSHRYAQADSLVKEAQLLTPTNRAARQLGMELDIQAWNLDEAAASARRILLENPRDAAAAGVLGRIDLLRRDYDGAMRWARLAQTWDPNLADGFKLQAEAHFWNQQTEQAEHALRAALRRNPFDPDARFSYGYAIWRRVDATQLPLMARNWEVALQVDPLHYLTHWHFGNGHTHLTYVDYAHPTDDEVRGRLAEADELVRQGQVERAIARTREIGEAFPESVLPQMARGSYYYLHDQLPQEQALDSAQAQFEQILQRKAHYGPAHNGLAAVIKKRQFTHLAAYAELERAIQDTPVPREGSVFYDVFQDAGFYPGDRVKKMIARQIGPSQAYLEMIRKFDSNFAIPPLHHDLAMAMGSNWFRTQTTFDNRQWMDIRGVGSGAAGIEYIERGAHLERNVLAHEYAHLYHGRILTDKEDRAIRALYHQAMRDGRTLDYYASNNESEFFAQGYAGFLSEEKVHPLNHKSMNTRPYIAWRDPDYYAFLDELLGKQTAYMEGRTELLDDNWAQTYLSLARRARGRGDTEQAAAYLDTSLTYSATYIPTHLELAELDAERGDFDEAFDRLRQAEALDSTYAPVLVSRAAVLHRQAMDGRTGFEESLQEQEAAFRRAELLEEDLAERASLNRRHRERLRDYAQHEQALAVAERYLETAPEISTYLRDRKEEAQVFAHDMRSRLGRSTEAVAFFEDLVAQNPQNFAYRMTYADVLVRAGDPDGAVLALEHGQRILASAGERNLDYTLRLALLHARAGRLEQSQQQLDAVQADEMERLSDRHRLKLVETLLELDRTEQARNQLEQVDGVLLPDLLAERTYLESRLHAASGATEHAAAS